MLCISRGSSRSRARTTAETVIVDAESSWVPVADIQPAVAARTQHGFPAFVAGVTHVTPAAPAGIKEWEPVRPG